MCTKKEKNIKNTLKKSATHSRFKKVAKLTFLYLNKKFIWNTIQQYNNYKKKNLVNVFKLLFSFNSS